MLSNSLDMSPPSPRTVKFDGPLTETAEPLAPVDLASEMPMSFLSAWSWKPLRDRVKTGLRIRMKDSPPAASRQRRGALAKDWLTKETTAPTHAQGASQTVLFALHDEELEQCFSEVDPGLFVGLTLDALPPSSLIWPHSTWGNWKSIDFTHVVCIATAAEARGVYKLQEPLKPVREAALDGVRQLWLTVPDEVETGAGEEVRLTLYQLHAAGRFLHDAADEEACVLIAGAAGREVDVMALAVCYIASHRDESAYATSRRLDEDTKVRDAWKGHLSWQDVEYVQSVLV